MPVQSITSLREMLRLGLSVFSELWSYKAKNWVTGVHAADIDNDGDIEIIAGSRDGRVRALTKEGLCRWERVVGKKDWVGPVIGVPPIKGSDNRVRIIIGTRDGRIYALDQYGNTVGKDGSIYTVGKDGRAVKGDEEVAAYWLQAGSVIRRLYADPTRLPYIIASSEDGYIYALHCESGELQWRFQTGGWVRAMSVCDINGDGEVEILAGSSDRYLYVLNSEGQCLNSVNMQYPVHVILATDLNNDGQVEIIVATDGEDLAALTPELQEIWRHQFDNRFLSLHVADIDEDGYGEIIGASEDKHIYILNKQCKVLWRHYQGHSIFGVYAIDFDGDGETELLAGAEDCQLHAFRVRLIEDLERRIRRCYVTLGKSASNILLDLSADERHMLQDILKEEIKQYQGLKDITLKHAEELIKAKQYTDAVLTLLKLEQQKVQLPWHRGKKDKLGHVRSLCIGHMNAAKREIVVGTDEGDIRVFNAGGRNLWSLHISDRVLTVQTGSIDHSQGEDIVVCSSDRRMHIVNATTRQEKQCPLNTEISCLYLSDGNKQRSAEIIVGSDEKKLCIYGGDMLTPQRIISIPEDIRLLHAYAPTEGDTPEIIAGSTGRTVYAFTRKGGLLWSYETWDHVQAIFIKDIDGDGEVEIILGSEDRNVHVLDSRGHLKWRYFLPHSVLAVHAIDVDQDGRVEVLVGCADGYLYVFSKDGDLKWKHRTNDRIHAIDAEDIDGDGNVEIAVGSEDKLELLQVVNQQQIRSLIDQCLLALQRGNSGRQVMADLLKSSDPILEAFALRKLAETDFAEQDLDDFERLMKDDFVGVRRSLPYALVKAYPAHPQRVHQMLEKLSMDTEQEVRLAFVEQLSQLIKSDWSQGFEYLEGFSRNSDRLVRRAVIRQLYHLIDITQERERYQQIFHLLLKAAKDKESEWIQQEAARALAHFLSLRQGGLAVYMQFFIIRELHPKILDTIAHQTTAPVAQHFISAVIPLLTDLDNTNVIESLKRVVEALEDMRSLKHGNDSWMTYDELLRLFKLRAIDDIARYQCTIDAAQFTPGDRLAQINLTIFNGLNSITRYLRIYLKRESVNDRLSGLLEANRAIDEMNRIVEREYSALLLGEPITKLPARGLFKLLLKRWREMILVQLSDLRGKPDLQAELQTRHARYEEQVGVLFKVCNTGRGSAENVKVTLLHSSDFDVVGRNSIETELLFSQQEISDEFTIRPHADCLDLKFEIIYDDAESPMKRRLFGDRLELQAVPMQQEFHYIPNPYSTGTPIHDSHMFYGRDRDIAYLKSNLARTAAQTVILLYGQRRSGKTTLLLHLVNTPVLEEHIPVLIDMQRESYNINLSKLLYTMAYYIARAMRKKGRAIYLQEQEDFVRNPTFSFGMFLDEVETQLNGHKLILLIDEFEVLEEQIKKGRLEPELLEYLRSMMQHHYSINFLLSGTHKLEQLTQANWSVFFNIARQYRLSKLSPQGADNLIKKPVEGHLEYDSYALEKIRQLTGDQPYLIHLICRSLVDHCNYQRKAYVTINDVNTVLPEVMQSCESHFDWLWKQLTTEEQIILSLMTEEGKDEGRPLSQVEIEEGYRYHRIPYKRERMQVCLSSLIDADIIEADDAVRGHPSDDIRYRIQVSLIRAWLGKNKPLELILAE